MIIFLLWHFILKIFIFPFPSINNPLCCEDSSLRNSELTIYIVIQVFFQVSLELVLGCIFEGFANYNISDWTRLVDPGSTFAKTVSLHCNNILMTSVCWALWTFASNIFTVDPIVGILVNILAPPSRVHSIIKF